MSASLRILLVDDEAIIRSTLADFLRDAGHQVDDVASGTEALGLAAEIPYRLAIIDLQMPDLDGYTLLTRLRQLKPQLPVIVMTGHGTQEIESQILGLGASVLLRKPIKLRELEDLMAKLCP